MPTVACSENAAAVPLPAYPVAPVANDDVSLLAYSKEQQLWAISAIGAYSQERAKRRAIASCLADLRTRGLIN